MIEVGSVPPVDRFATQFYDYAIAQQIIVQICIGSTEAVRDVCAIDLSRGPYLFTYSQPASALSPILPPYLLLDLSDVHERAFGEFISAYTQQVKPTDSTDGERIDNLRRRLLSITPMASDWMSPSKTAGAGWWRCGASAGTHVARTAP